MAIWARARPACGEVLGAREVGGFEHAHSQGADNVVVIVTPEHFRRSVVRSRSRMRGTRRVRGGSSGAIGRCRPPLFAFLTFHSFVGPKSSVAPRPKAQLASGGRITREDLSRHGYLPSPTRVRSARSNHARATS